MGYIQNLHLETKYIKYIFLLKVNKNIKIYNYETISPDNKKIVSGSYDKTICMWNIYKKIIQNLHLETKKLIY